MKLEQLFLLHLMAGAGVAVCVYLSCPERAGTRWFQTLAAIVFWPLFLPLLLAHRPQVESSSPPQPAPNSLDELDRAIAQVEEELTGVLPGLEGWGESIRERAEARFRELRANWTAQAGRVREMDQIMARTRNAQTQGEGLAESERMRGSQEAIRQNLQRLEELRQRTLADLFGMLAQVRELVSLIHLARFSGALVTRAEDLLAQLGAVGREVSAAPWRQEPGENGVVASGCSREEIRVLKRQA